MSVTNEMIAKAKQEKWFRADLSFKYHAGQKLINKTFKESVGKLFVGNVSRQFGKSYWAVTKAIEQALIKPNSQIRYGAAFHSDLVDFIIPAFDKVMEDCPEAIKGVYKTQGSKYVFPNGSIIKLVGIDKHPNGLRGNTLDLVIIDECGFVGNLDYIYKSIIIPATLHRPDAKIILISTPPSTPAHPFVDYCHRARLENCYSTFTVYDNPMLSEDAIQEAIEESGGEESTTWKREYLCHFITDADLAIIPEWEDKYVQDLAHDEFQGYYHKYVGMDLGVKDFTAVLFGYYDFKRASIVIEEELMMNGPSMTTASLAAAIKAKESVMWKDVPPFRRISDSNWPLLLADFSKEHNLPFISTSKVELEQMINEVRLMVQKGQVIVHPRCTYLIGCLKYGVWDTKKTKFAQSKVYGHFDHLAALIYLIRNLAKHSNPIPSTHGHQSHTSWIVKAEQKDRSTHNSRVLAEALLPKKPKI